MMSISLAREKKKQKEPEPVSETVALCADGTGAGVAAFYVTLLREKKGEERFCVARDLQRYLNGEFRDESAEFQKDFIEYMDCKSDGQTKTSALYDMIHGKGGEKAPELEHLRQSGVILIVVLAETILTTETTTRVVRMASYLTRGMLTMEEQGMEMAARGMAFLIQTSKGYAAELVEKCLDQSLEWAEEDLGANNPLTCDRRLAAAIMLRELALFCSTAFFLRAQQFFTNIFKIMRYPKSNVRLAAANALHAALTVTSQREAKQKNEWYKKCFDEAMWSETKPVSWNDKMGKDETSHSSLLAFNELLRISDANLEQARLSAIETEKETISVESNQSTSFGNGIDFLRAERFQSTVESKTARALMADNALTIFHRAMTARTLKSAYVNETVIEMLPRLMLYLEGSNECDQAMDYLLPLTSKSRSAQLAVGLMVIQCGDRVRKHMGRLFKLIDQSLQSALHGSGGERKKGVHGNMFVMLTFIVRTFSKSVLPEMKCLLPLILACPLSFHMKQCLQEIYTHMEPLRTDVLDGLLEQLSMIIRGVPLPSKTSTATTPSKDNQPCKPPKDPAKQERCVLALRTLGQFQFQRHSLQMFLQHIADSYLVCESPLLRLASVKCCVAVLNPFIQVYERIHREHRQLILALIHSVLKCLCSVAVVDSDVSVRMCVVSELCGGSRQLLSHLAQPELLELLRLCLRDEKLEMQEATVCLLGKIGIMNPALVLPRLRTVLLETLGQLTNSGEGRLEQHSARLIAHMAHQSPKFMRPYMGSLMEALIPKLRFEQKYADVTIHVLSSISELSIVGGSEVVKSIEVLFPKLLQFVTDASSLKRREAALRAIGHLCASTAYVVDPYKDYPLLLDQLISLMRTEMSQSMRRQTMRVLGVLGALDPYTHKVFRGAVQSVTSTVTTALSLPMTRKVVDPRQDIVQWFNYEKCTLEEFYPSITIANLMVMLESDVYAPYFAEITQDLLSIFRTLGTQWPQFVEQVFPQLIAVTEKGKHEMRHFFLKQLAGLLEIIQSHAKPFLPQVFNLLASSWREDTSLHVTVVLVLETMATAFGQEFAPYVPEVIPYLLEGMRMDKSTDRKMTAQCISCVCALGGCLVCHLHLLMHPVLAVVDDLQAPIQLRKHALECIHTVATREDVSDYSPRIIQTWTKAMTRTELQPSCLRILTVMAQQRWKHLDVFRRTMEIALSTHGLTCQKYNEYLQALGPTGKYIDDKTTGAGAKEDLMFVPHVTAAKSDARFINHTSNPVKQRINIDVVNASWNNFSMSSKEDWSDWLVKFRMSFCRASSSSAIRAVVSLADQHQQLSKDLFNAAFMSVWTELTELQQLEVTRKVVRALDESNHIDVAQTILNLAEFMDHSEKGPLPVHYDRLGKAAERVKAYAKALRYKELDIIKHKNGEISLDDAHAIITFSNKLNLQEEAAGVIKVLETNSSDIGMLMRSKWYEKLNDWEKSLQLLTECREGPNAAMAKTEEWEEHEMKCLEALGRWEELESKVGSVSGWKTNVGVMAARTKWALAGYLQDDAQKGKMKEMSEIVEKMNENSQDGSFLRAVVNVYQGKFEDAVKYIEKCRDIHDAQLTAMASESYERAYGAMLLLQQLTELEEAIDFAVRPERRSRVALVWSRRLQACTQNVDHWHKLLMMRSVVLSPQEMHPLRVKFASLCRKQGKHSMCKAQLAALLGLPAGADLHTATPPFTKPQLVLALCKQLWLDNYKSSAVTTLEHLGRHLDKLISSTNNSPQEAKRIVAKTFVKLGEWTEAEDGWDVYGVMERSSGSVAASSYEATSALAAARHSMLQQNMVLNGTTPSTLNVANVSGRRWTIPSSQLASPVTDRTSDAELTDKIIQYYTKATEYDHNWHKAWHRLATACFNAVSKEKEKNSKASTAAAPPANALSFITPPPSKLNLYVSQAVKAFSRALLLSKGSRLEDTLRLMSLWFDHSHDDAVYAQLRESLKTLPIEMWLEVVPQLMARLDSSSHATQLIHHVVLEVAREYPQALVYAITVATKSTNPDRARNALDILSVVKEMHPALVEQAAMVSHELVRCAILWHEQWHEALDEASRLYFHEKNIKGMLDVLEPMHVLLEKGAETLKEHSFIQAYASDLSDARKFCHAFQRTANGKEITQAWELYYAIFKRITAQLRQMPSFDLNYISPVLQKARDLQLAVPGTFDPRAQLVTIYSFNSHLVVINSKQRPRKLTMRGSDGKEYCFLLKGHEDPRQDERVMQLFALVNTLLLHNSDTCRKNLNIQRYSIVALSQNSGLIGWLPDCDTLHTLIRDYRERSKNNTSLSQEHKVMQNIAHEMEQLTVLQKMQLMQAALLSNPGDDLRQVLWLKSPNSEVWFERRTNYTRSMACMSMVGYILGLGDRHPSNLLLDRLTGKIVHIDFGDCFDVAMTREKFPEKIPFRLTRMLIKAMEITGIEGNYRLTCERVLAVLRANKDSLLAVLEAFVYDPLINWRLLDGIKRHPAERKDPKTSAIVVPESVSRTAIDNIKLKLAGIDTDGSCTLSVPEHVHRLVTQATLQSNLAQCYVGWCPFW